MAFSPSRHLVRTVIYPLTKFSQHCNQLAIHRVFKYTNTCECVPHIQTQTSKLNFPKLSFTSTLRSRGISQFHKQLR